MKIKYIVIAIVVLLALAFAALLVFGERWAKQKIENKIASVQNLSYDSLNIQLAEESIVFKGIKFNPEGTSLECRSITIQGIDIYKLLIANKVILKEIAIDSLRIDHYLLKDSTKKSGNKSIDADVTIDNINIKDSYVRLFQHDSTQMLTCDFEVSAANIDLKKLKNPKEVLHTVTDLKTNNFRYLTKDSLYAMGSKQVLFRPEKSQLRIDSIYITSNYDKYQFGYMVGHEKNWIDIDVDSAILDVSSLEDAFIKHNVNKVTLYSPDILVFLDKRLPFPEDKRPKLLREQLAEEKLSIGIDSILLIDADITYEEYVKKAEGPGSVSFNNLNGYVSNLYSYNRKHNIPPHLVASCDLLNVTKLYADITFPLGKTEKTLVKGKLESMDLRAFNKMMKYVAFTEVEQGQLHNMDFEFTYDQTNSDGTMNFEYEDLKIDFLNKDDAESGGFFNEVKGFLANTFVVNKRNTYDSGKFRIGQISYERNMKKSMFNFWWKSILTGVQSSTGIKPSKEKIDTN